MTKDLLEKFESNTALLLVGHGSRNASALNEFSQLVSGIKLELPGIEVEYGYLEFALPTIESALDNLKKKGFKKVIAIPIILFAATHAKNDIPSVLNNYSKKNNLNILYGRELGMNNLMIGAAGGRIKEAIYSTGNNNLIPEETLLVVVGRGSSDPDANSNISKVTRLLVECFGFAWGEYVFSGVTFPLVEPGLRKAVKLKFKKIIVFPYFLFSGVLISRIRNQISIIAKENPDIEFINAKYLGDHPLVIENIKERILEVFEGDNLMNCSLCKYRSNFLGFENEVGAPQLTHHHNSEDLVSNQCQLCIYECTGECERNGQIHSHHEHEHEHIFNSSYPHSEHPLGPVNLPANKKREI